MAVHSYRLVTEEEYLRRERQAQTKSEYLRGEILAFAGASRVHNRIVFNTGGLLYNALREHPCEAYITDMRVRIAEAGAYFYPDVVVVCGQPQFLDEHQDTLLNPVLIVEVLSPSTEAFDRGEKSFYYRQLGSLREYLLVSQDRVRIERYVRQPDGEWSLHDYTDLGQVVRLESLGVEIPIAQIYEGVDFADSR